MVSNTLSTTLVIKDFKSRELIEFINFPFTAADTDQWHGQTLIPYIGRHV